MDSHSLPILCVRGRRQKNLEVLTVGVGRICTCFVFLFGFYCFRVFVLCFILWFCVVFFCFDLCFLSFCLLVCRVLCLCFSVLFLYFCDFVLCLFCFMSFVYVVFWFYFFASLFFCIFVLCFCCSLCVLPLFYVSGPFSHFRVFVFLCVV